MSYFVLMGVVVNVMVKRYGYDLVVGMGVTHASAPPIKHRKHMDDTKTGVLRRLPDQYGGHIASDHADGIVLFGKWQRRI
jgi:hypothetical protein